jgi:hypothetical protein
MRSKSLGLALQALQQLSMMKDVPPSASSFYNFYARLTLFEKKNTDARQFEYQESIL